MESVEPFAAILLVLGLMCGSLVLLRKKRAASFPFGRRAPGARQMEILERLPLGPNHSLHLVRIGRRSFVIATVPGACQLIGHADEAPGADA